MLTWACPARGSSSPSARTPGKPPSRSRTARAISRAASTSAPTRLTLNAISGGRAPTITPPAAGSRRSGPKSGASSPASIRRCSSSGPAAPVERGAASRGELPVEKDREAQLLADAARERERRRAGALGVLGAQRHDRDDVRDADPRMRAVVAAQVDPPARAGDRGQQRLDELLLVTDEREHRAVVIRVGVNVEHVGMLRQRRADRSEHACVSPLREVRDGFQRQLHGRSLRSGREHPRALLAHLRRHEAEPHAEVERLAAHADARAPPRATRTPRARRRARARPCARPAANQSSVAVTVNAAPIACANRFAGPGE